jgi:hypothetical protein
VSERDGVCEFVCLIEKDRIEGVCVCVSVCVCVMVSKKRECNIFHTFVCALKQDT